VFAKFILMGASAMIALMDHENFDKCRRALIASSVMLIVACIFKFDVNAFEFYGLKLSANKNEYLWLGIVFVLYFLVIYSIHNFGTYVEAIESKVPFLKSEIDKHLDGDLRDFHGMNELEQYELDYDSRDYDDDLIERATSDKKKIDDNLANIKRVFDIIKIYGGNIIPPYLIGVYALYRAISIIINEETAPKLCFKVWWG
jgi:hypothetical protein